MSITRDPVFGMAVEERAAAASAVHEGVRYFFCSEHCAGEFAAHPSQALHAAPNGAGPFVTVRQGLATLTEFAEHESPARMPSAPPAEPGDWACARSVSVLLNARRLRRVRI